VGALSWLLNLEFKGGLFMPSETPIAVMAAEARPRGPEAIETRHRGVQAVEARRRGPVVVETDIRVLTEVNAAAGLTDEWTHIILDADFTSPSGITTYAQTPRYATGLLWTPEADKTYWFKCHLMLTYAGAQQSISTETGFGTWPTNLTDHAIMLECATAADTTAFPACAWGQNDGGAADPGAVQLSGVHVPGRVSHLVGEGVIVTSPTTTGSLEVYIDRSVAGGTATTHTLLAGSWLAWQEVPRA
jgi:hypothetical protein